jgi:hypothetical protein|tara:strand:- start:9 stop:161 length:153 start_codon:yes stop_codon:yes gene_type:complete
MDKIKKVVSAPLFQSALAGGIGILILMQGNILYSGIAFGIGIGKFFDAFK